MNSINKLFVFWVLVNTKLTAENIDYLLENIYFEFVKRHQLIVAFFHWLRRYLNKMTATSSKLEIAEI